MGSGKNCGVETAISLVLRIAVASLFGAAAIAKFSSGNPEGLVSYFQSTFQETWLPAGLVTLYAKLVPYIEALIPIWLLSGYKLKLGWFVTSIFMVSLAFGLVVAKSPGAADNYMYVLVCCAGLYFSQFDSVCFFKCSKK